MSSSDSNPLRIAVLDDYHQLSSSYIPSALSNSITTFHDTLLDPAPLLARLEPFDVLVTMRERTPLPAEIIDGLPNLKLILTTGMRNKGIDMDACARRGVKVYGTPNHELPPDAPKDLATAVQHTIALLLSLLSHIPRDQSLLAANDWTHHLPLNTYIGGLTLGIVGLGKLGTGVARIAKLAFGMRLIAWSQNLSQEKADEAAKGAGLEAGSIQVVSKEDLFSTADVVSLHVVLSERSRGIVGAADLARMKPTACLVNTSRGPLVDQGALLEVLQQGKIMGAAIDVFDIEPLPLDSPWRTTKWGVDGRSDVVMTPHTGYSYDFAMRDMWKRTGENLDRLAAGRDLLWRIV